MAEGNDWGHSVFFCSRARRLLAVETQLPSVDCGWEEATLEGYHCLLGCRVAAGSGHTGWSGGSRLCTPSMKGFLEETDETWMSIQAEARVRPLLAIHPGEGTQRSLRPSSAAARQAEVCGRVAQGHSGHCPVQANWINALGL